MNEGIVASAMKQTVMESIDEGVLVGETWLDGTSLAVGKRLVPMGGSNEERLLAAEISDSLSPDPHEDSIGLRIEAKGSPEQREDRCIRHEERFVR